MHAGAAACLHGLHTEIDDIDIRVFHRHLPDLIVPLGRCLDARVTLRPYVYGRDRSYLNHALLVDTTPPTEITSEMIAVRAGWVFRFPYSPELFASPDLLRWDSRVPVSDLYGLLLYYLILRRAPPHFNDLQAVVRLLRHPELDVERFKRSLAHSYYREPILRVLREMVRRGRQGEGKRGA